MPCYMCCIPRVVVIVSVTTDGIQPVNNLLQQSLEVKINLFIGYPNYFRHPLIKPNEFHISSQNKCHIL